MRVCQYSISPDTYNSGSFLKLTPPSYEEVHSKVVSLLYPHPNKQDWLYNLPLNTVVRLVVGEDLSIFN